ncbi:MAG: hypothetical protein K0S61_2777 [Anaerocolumna sp.]|jgi:hypothetical protein|nr:hypothetical protein [Anaerocolumna sp.]
MVIEANRWLTVFAMAFTFFAVLVIAVVFFIDPFLYYRNISNDKKLMEPRYTSIGIIKNYKHDMTILGMDSSNSMDMLYIRNYHERKPVQLGIEDSNLNEVLMLYTMAQENSNTDLYFINVKAEEFLENIEFNLSSKKFPKYLYNKSGLDDIKYLLNYEICFRYIPLNTIIDTAFKLKKSLPAAMQDGTEIDKVVQWKVDSQPVKDLAKGAINEFHMGGFITNVADSNLDKDNIEKDSEAINKINNKEKNNEEINKKDIDNKGINNNDRNKKEMDKKEINNIEINSKEINNKGINNKEIDKEDISELKTQKELEDSIDNYLDIVLKQLKPDQTLIFGFMPYSIEYWTNLSVMDFETIMYAKEYFIKESSNMDNVKIVDLQGIPEISNPINYTKQQNLKVDLIKLYTDSIFDETLYVTLKSYDKNRKNLNKQIQLFFENQ